MTRREALEKRIATLRGELIQAWADHMPVRRLKALREYLQSAVQELDKLEREAAAQQPGSGPGEGPVERPGGQN